jgi:Spy/CpxP family protein refolding chaperone
MADETKSRTIKLAAAVVVLVGALGFVYARYHTAHPALPPPVAAAQAEAQPARLYNDDERARMRSELAQRLNLTSEQRRQLEQIDRQSDEQDPLGALEARRASFEAMLNPQQLDEARRYFDEHRDEIRERIRERIREETRVLPPDQQEAFRQRLRERLRARGLPVPPEGAPTPATSQ